MRAAPVKTNEPANKGKAKPFFQRQTQPTFFGDSSFEDRGSTFFSPDAIQTKLTIGQPGDRYEVEADAMADRVVQKLSSPAAVSPDSELEFQRKCQQCEHEEDIQKKENQGEPIDTAIPSSMEVQPLTGQVAQMQLSNSPANNNGSAVQLEVQTEEDLPEKEEDDPEEAHLAQLKVYLQATDEEDSIQRSCRECEEGEREVLFKLDPLLQRNPNSDARDEASIRDRVLQIAHQELGKVEASKTDASGRRIGYERLLEYFHLAAPGEWPDGVIKFKRPGFPSWCGIFSVYTIKTAGIDLGNWQMGKGVSAFNSLKVTNNPKPGDIGYIDQPYQHHCIVTEVSGDTVKSIDGNSGWYSEVIEKTRPRSQFTGFFTPFTGSEKFLQPKEDGTISGPAQHSLTDRLHSSKGKGTPLDRDTGQQMGQAFNADFSQVRIHTGSEAVEMSQSLGAQAFTHGSDVYFNKGKYDVDSNQGKHLLAHELTHTIQQGAALQKKPKITATSNQVQRLPDFVASEINDYARHIPGWNLFCVIVGFNPLLMATVDRNATNLLEGLFGLVPGGTYIFDRLREYEIVDQAYNWVTGKLVDLQLTRTGLERMLEEVYEDMEIVRLDAVSYNIGVLERKFQNLYNRVVSFASQVADKILGMIKEVLMETLRSLAASIPGYNLLIKILGYDPLTDQEVEATTAEIIEDFLILIGATQELEKMKELGTLEETAAWIDEQLALLNFSLEEIKMLFAEAWDAFSLADLADPIGAVRRTVAIFTPLATRVFNFAWNVSAKVFEFIKQALLNYLKSFANEVPGYHLLTVILGKDPFTEEVVPSTAENIIRGFMGLIPGGEAQFQQMKESGAIARTAAWIEGEIAALGMTWEYIKGMFLEIWNSFTIADLFTPIPAFQRIINRFGEPLGRILRFLVRVVLKIIEIILEIMKFPLDIIRQIIANARQAFQDIKRDPIGFLKNLLRAVKEGFSMFFGNIATHLLNGVTGWLFGQLENAGITPPQDLSFKSILGMVLQILGITADRIMEKVAQRIGPERMERIRGMWERLTGIWSFVKDVMERGPVAIWERIQEKITDLWNTVLDSVKNWIMTKVIEKVTTKLLSMLDPTGIMAVVNSFIATYNAIESFIEYLREMLEIVNSFVAGVAEIARGSITRAATFLEGALADGLPIAIGFLANQVGLGSIGEKVGEMIERVREMVDGALDWLVDKAVSAGEGLISMGRGAMERVAGWLGFRENLTTTSGATHTIYVEEKGNKRDLIIESTPSRVGAFLNEKHDEIDSNENLEATKKNRLLGQIRHTRNLLQGLNALMNNPEQEQNPRIPQLIQQIIDNIKELEVSGESDDILIPSADFNPGFINPYKALTFSARYVFKGTENTPSNHEPGNDNTSGKLKDAWQVLTDMRLNFKWVRFHILNSRLGGKATDSNLIATPKYINDEYEQNFETHLKGYYDQGLPIWMNAQVGYDQDNYSGHIPSSYSARGGAMKYENDQWIEDANKQTEFSKQIDTPQSHIFNINTIMDNPEEAYLIVNLTSVTHRIINILRSRLPDGGYSSFRQMERAIEREIYGDLGTEIVSFEETEIAGLPEPTREQVKRADKLKHQLGSADFTF